MLETISPEAKSYVVGFLQGDGSSYEQSRNKGKIVIELAYRDKDILDKIEALFDEVYIGRNGRVRDTNFKEKYRSSILSICSKELRAELRPYIPVGRKPDRIKPPVNMKEFDRYSYIRGLTDADGSLGITGENKPFWSLCTSSEYIKDFIIDDIKEVLSFDKRLNRNKRDNVYNIVLFSEDAVTYTKLLYNNSTIYLNRKYNEYNKIQSWVRDTPKRKGRKKSWLEYEDIIVLNSDISLKDKCTLLERSQNSIKTRSWRLRQK